MTNPCECSQVRSKDQLTYSLAYFCTFALSHTIQAEWRAAQMDERAMEGLEDSDEDGVSFS